jgi:hypothetical protein
MSASYIENVTLPVRRGQLAGTHKEKCLLDAVVNVRQSCMFLSITCVPAFLWQSKIPPIDLITMPVLLPA